MRRDLGDFQTPPELVEEVLDALEPISTRWRRVLEPTCGRGHFIAGLLARARAPVDMIGIEIQESHFQVSRNVAFQSSSSLGSSVDIRHGDIFALDLAHDLEWRTSGPLLVIGNPPWVTSAQLGRLGCRAGAPRGNPKLLRGLDALTGSSNFDIAEAIWLKLIVELADQQPTIALLCKTSVARGLLQFAQRGRLPIGDASIRRIDAARWFHAAVDACLLMVTVAPGSTCAHVPVLDSLAETTPRTTLGFSRGWLIADRDAYEPVAFVDGICPLAWRQGLKHDAADVMELLIDPARGLVRNRDGESVAVEPEWIFPLLKGADLGRPQGARPNRGVIVTQHHTGDDTRGLAASAPALWKYLERHAGRLGERKSSIYRGRPPFSIFGIGPYSFASYKVAIAGMNKSPEFHAIGPRDGRPVMLDDTCYFLSCGSREEAALLATICNHPSCLDFLRAASFSDSKRPITKAVLSRIDLGSILGSANWADLIERASVIAKGIPGEPGAETIRDLVGRLSHEWGACSAVQTPRIAAEPTI